MAAKFSVERPGTNVAGAFFSSSPAVHFLVSPRRFSWTRPTHSLTCTATVLSATLLCVSNRLLCCDSPVLPSKQVKEKFHVPFNFVVTRRLCCCYHHVFHSHFLNVE